jgi:hypothetical protein
VGTYFYGENNTDKECLEENLLALLTAVVVAVVAVGRLGYLLEPHLVL